MYGALGIVLVCTLVVGTVVAARSNRDDHTQVDRRLADQFLDAILRSTVANGTTLRQALEESCFRLHCSVGTWNTSRLRAAVESVAAPLSRALDSAYAVAVIAEGTTQLRVGGLPQDAPGSAATANVFRPREGTFLGISALLGPR